MTIAWLFQQSLNHSNEFAIGLALIGSESHVFVRQIALLVDDYDCGHGVQTERLVDRLIGIAQRRDFQIVLLRESLQVGVRSVIARAGLRTVDAHPVNLHSARRVTVGDLLQRGQLFRRQRNPRPAERHHHNLALLVSQPDLTPVQRMERGGPALRRSQARDRTQRQKGHNKTYSQSTKHSTSSFFSHRDDRYSPANGSKGLSVDPLATARGTVQSHASDAKTSSTVRSA